MSQSVVLNNPIMLVGFIGALLLCFFGARAKKLPISVCGVLLFVATLAYALINGAELYETATVALLFFVVRLAVPSENGG